MVWFAYDAMERVRMEEDDTSGEKTMYGKKVMSVIRSTVLIGPDGKVLRHWAKVKKAADHPAEVLAVVEELVG